MWWERVFRATVGLVIASPAQRGRERRDRGVRGYSVTAASLGPRGAHESREHSPLFFQNTPGRFRLQAPPQGRVTIPSFGPHAPTVATTRTFVPFSTPSTERGIVVSRTPMLFPASGL